MISLFLTLSALVTVSVPSNEPAISAVSAMAVPSILPARVTSSLLDLTVPFSLPPTTAAAQPSVVPSKSTPSPITKLLDGGSAGGFGAELEEDTSLELLLTGGAPAARASLPTPPLGTEPCTPLGGRALTDDRGGGPVAEMLPKPPASPSGAFGEGSVDVFR